VTGACDTGAIVAVGATVVGDADGEVGDGVGCAEGETVGQAMCGGFVAPTSVDPIVTEVAV
jgi:hypothetical protein